MGEAPATARGFSLSNSATEPGLAMLEHLGVAKPAFQVRAASGAKYEGDGVSFWEARGEATVRWPGSDMTCKRRPEGK